VGPITIVFGLVLSLLGLAGYFGTGTTSVTALIPTFFGVPLMVLGFLALKDSLRKHAMHLAAVLGLLGFLGATIKLVQGILAAGEVKFTAGPISQALMALICAVFVGLCVRSFIQARRNRARN
jgi:hypothetical protein